jgi:protein gp37
MADQRGEGISWTDQTWNPMRGCSKVSEGCKNCYAATMAGRFSGPGEPYDGLAKPGGFWTGKVRLIATKLPDPIRWTKPRKIFVNSMSDVFHETVSIAEIASVFAVMLVADRHIYQILTKRPERMVQVLKDDWRLFWLLVNAEVAMYATSSNKAWQKMGMAALAKYDSFWPGGAMVLPGPPVTVPKHIWLGASVEDQRVHSRIDLLCDVPAAVRFLSVEPMIGPLVIGPGKLIHWVICGGESGNNRRRMDGIWAEALREECRVYGIPFWFKQWGDEAVDDHSQPLLDGTATQQWPIGF